MIELQFPDGKVLGIGMLPDRKRPSLYFREGNVYKPLAYFTDEAATEMAEDLIGRLAHDGVSHENILEEAEKFED